MADIPLMVLSNTYTNERRQDVCDAEASQVTSKASSTPTQAAEAVRASLVGRETTRWCR
jgi:DNA-binding NarL/FixJ family response regulator